MHFPPSPLKPSPCLVVQCSTRHLGGVLSWLGGGFRSLGTVGIVRASVVRRRLRRGHLRRSLRAHRPQLPLQGRLRRAALLGHGRLHGRRERSLVAAQLRCLSAGRVGLRPCGLCRPGSRHLLNRQLSLLFLGAGAGGFLFLGRQPRFLLLGRQRQRGLLSLGRQLRGLCLLGGQSPGGLRLRLRLRERAGGLILRRPCARGLLCLSLANDGLLDGSNAVCDGLPIAALILRGTISNGVGARRLRLRLRLRLRIRLPGQLRRRRHGQLRLRLRLVRCRVECRCELAEEIVVVVGLGLDLRLRAAAGRLGAVVPSPKQRLQVAKRVLVVLRHAEEGLGVGAAGCSSGPRFIGLPIPMNAMTITSRTNVGSFCRCIVRLRPPVTWCVGVVLGSASVEWACLAPLEAAKGL